MNIWHFFEYVIIGAVVIIQLLYSRILYNRIARLKSIFNKKIRVVITEEQTESPKIPYVRTDGGNKIIKNIENAINQYLKSNFGASVNFSAIKDIADREVDILDDQINQTIGVPLYTGLAASMIGIVFGLFSMPTLEAEGFSLGINSLIDGVKIAMIGSLIGLASTTILSSFFYKKAKTNLQEEKNEQINTLQAELLPELIKAEDTGVSGLKASLDRFARETPNLTDRLTKAAKYITDQATKNLESQSDLNMKVLKVSKWNLELFEKMENNMESFHNFSVYLSNMERITSQLQEFANRTSDVNRIINDIGGTLKESRQLMQFLSAHFDKIKNSGDAALKSVGLAETHFEEAINALKNRTEEMMSNLYKSAGSHEVALENIYKEIEGNLNSITSQYVDTFKDAYSDSIPFQQINQLDNLELIKESNSSMKATQEEHLELVKKMNTFIEDMQRNQPLLKVLSSIEDNLKKSQQRTIKIGTDSNPHKKGNSQKPNENVSLGKVIKKIF